MRTCARNGADFDRWGGWTNDRHPAGIFGPILPIISYGKLEDAIAYVNAHPRPLALYVFSDHRGTIERVLERTTSGNVSVIDTLFR